MNSKISTVENILFSDLLTLENQSPERISELPKVTEQFIWSLTTGQQTKVFPTVNTSETGVPRCLCKFQQGALGIAPGTAGR